jgi:hypothetical protein
VCYGSHGRWIGLYVLVGNTFADTTSSNLQPRPHFDSPSVFCRILDQDRGGHFSISPTSDDLSTTKQHYLPSSNILQTRYLKEDGVMNLLDCEYIVSAAFCVFSYWVYVGSYTSVFPRPNNKTLDSEYHSRVLTSEHTGHVTERPDLKQWLVRRVECMRGYIDVNVEVFPAFSK